MWRLGDKDDYWKSLIIIVFSFLVVRGVCWNTVGGWIRNRLHFQHSYVNKMMFIKLCCWVIGNGQENNKNKKLLTFLTASKVI